MDKGIARLPDSKTGAKTLHLPPAALTVLTDLPRIDGNPHVIPGFVAGACWTNLEKPWRAIRKAATVVMWKANGSADLIALIEQLEQSAAAKEKPLPTFDDIEAAAIKAKISLPVALSNVRLHDLRHAFASVAASSGMGLPIIGKMLGHTQAQTTQRYAHLAADPVAAAAASVAGKIEAAMNSGASGGKVISLPRKIGGGH
jgi:integrase